MPLPNDERLIALSEEILKQFEAMFGPHPGFRPVHAKGILLTGTFTPPSAAASLTRAQHAVQALTPVTVRFSDSTATTGQEFLEFLQGVAQSDLAKVQAFVGSHPKALAFVQAITPLPTSFAKEKYFGLTAMKFTNKDGLSRYGRYTIVPEAGEEHLDAATAAAKGPDYLFNELNERLAKGPIKFKITVQVAEEGDVVNDATVHWPAERKVLELGTIALTSTVANDAHEQKHIIFDPIPRLDGIEPSDDPLLELRAAIYLISGRRRRTAPEQ